MTSDKGRDKMAKKRVNTNENEKNRVTFSAECPIGMAWGLKSLNHYGTIAIRFKL